MGISIELYRNRIGSFNSYSLVSRSSQSSKSTTTLLSSWSRRVAIFMSLTICLTLFAIPVSQAPTVRTVPSSPCPPCSSAPCSSTELCRSNFQHNSAWLPPWPPPWQSSSPPWPKVSEFNFIRKASHLD